MPITDLSIEDQNSILCNIKSKKLTPSCSAPLLETSHQQTKKIDITDYKKKLSEIVTNQGRNLQYISLLSRKYIK